MAGVLTGFARSVGMLSGCRFLLGAGEAFNWPSALKVTQRLVPPRDRALANGIFNSPLAIPPPEITKPANEWRKCP